MRNPRRLNNGGHVVYDVKGFDKEGSFEGERRYSDFNSFRQLLVTRLSGLYIPRIPPKKVIVRTYINLIFNSRETKSLNFWKKDATT